MPAVASEKRFTWATRPFMTSVTGFIHLAAAPMHTKAGYFGEDYALHEIAKLFTKAAKGSAGATVAAAGFDLALGEALDEEVRQFKTGACKEWRWPG